MRAAGPDRSTSSKNFSSDCHLRLTVTNERIVTMKLYYADTLNPRKACAVARYLNSPVEFVHVDLRKGEHKTPAFLAINPNGKVPAFSDGDLKLWEANAIMCY